MKHTTKSHAINRELLSRHTNELNNSNCRAASHSGAKKDKQTYIIAGIILSVIPALVIVLNHFNLISNA
jgi:hypothetical protein